METLFRTPWADQGCMETAASVVSIGGGIVILVLLGTGAFGWWSIRRQPDARREAWKLIPVLGGLGVLLLGVVVFAATSGTTTHHVAVENRTLVFQGCDGLTGFSERIAFADVEYVAYQARRTGGRSPRTVDEIIVKVKGRDESRAIPLSTDPDMVDHALLMRVMPRRPLDDYRNALDQRGIAVPPGLAAP